MFLNCFPFFREDHGDLGSFADFADQIQGSSQENYTMFYNRKTQAGTSDFFGVALVHAVKSFKHAILIFCRDSYTVIFDSNLYLFTQITQMNAYCTILFIIFDSIIAEIINDFIQNRTHAVQHRFIPVI